MVCGRAEIDDNACASILSISVRTGNRIAGNFQCGSFREFFRLAIAPNLASIHFSYHVFTHVMSYVMATTIRCED